MKPKRQFFVKRKEMKKLICTTILTVLMASAAIAGRQDYPEEYLGLPGDNLNLYAVMNLFQESETLEAFERSLNEENSRINNLDLNNDGRVAGGDHHCRNRSGPDLDQARHWHEDQTIPLCNHHLCDHGQPVYFQYLGLFL